jgi:hypothetical protein
MCRGSVHHSIIHKENPTRCNGISKFYFIFIWSSTCFERHTAHHQEPKTALAVSGFAYVEGCWTCSCWTLTPEESIKHSVRSRYTGHARGWKSENSLYWTRDFSLHQRPDRVWGPSSLLLNWSRSPFPSCKKIGALLWPLSISSPRLQLSGTVPPLLHMTS